MLDIEKLEEMRSKGLINQQEFEAQEKALFNKTMREVDGKKVAKNGIIYILLAWFLGAIGLHNFYAGYVGRGITQLLMTLLSWLFMFIPLLIVAIWVFFELLFVGKGANDLPFRGNRGVILGLKIIAVLWLFLGLYYGEAYFYSEEMIVG